MMKRVGATSAEGREARTRAMTASLRGRKALRWSSRDLSLRSAAVFATASARGLASPRA